MKKNKYLNIRISEELDEKIKRNAKHWGVSMSAYIALLVKLDGDTIDKVQKK